MEATTVWLIDAHPLLRSGLRSQLEGRGFEVTAEAGTIDEIARNGSNGCAPHLIILDFALGSSALVALKDVQPQSRVVIFAESAELSHLADMFSAGADGYLLKSISPSALVESLRLVNLGEKVFPSMLTDFLGAMRAGQGTQERVRVGDIALSQREIDIIRRLADGNSNKAIAKELSITEATVKVHLKTVLRKLGASNRTQVAIWAVQHGLTNNGSNSGGRNGRAPKAV
ncbi:MAG: response regulator transcription factor [Alphaproteobacteria bacterium]|nr:response regulator transcription factor [Alphaproteobacteria bacterium]